MADEQKSIDENEIEDLLEQAKGAAEQTSAGQAAATQQGAPVSQTEIDALLQSLGPAAAAPPPRPSHDPAPAAASSQESGGDDIHLLFEQAERALTEARGEDAEAAGLARFQFRDIGGTPASEDRATLELLSDVELQVRIELGRTRMHLEDVLKLRRGSVVSLDKLAGDPVDVYVNGRLIARGEVLVLNDNFCVRIAELVTGDEPRH